jgi:ribonuclease P protein component
LRSTADFERVYRAGRRAGDGLFAVNALPNELGHARLGMSVSTRTVGNSVRRNRVRRLIREVFRVRRPQLPALDLVVTSRPGARGAERSALMTSLERLIEQAARKAVQPTVTPP